ncbi:hypothetical protein CA13_65610 [Planctomycetes bacterium CA13]|uniref:YcxB-like C-terminal domain-containing protein n=1 Tax=Novipirellula herctigrandis TaxID=2527986 RepID=A0A5C5ZCD0_9BACT|nr:hypothetical protein CA13_65610 [Planctomycetes bacterium CA13]
MTDATPNPYQPPAAVETDSDTGSLLAIPICITLKMTTGYLMDAFTRTRDRNPTRKRWLFIRWPIAAFLLLLAAMLGFNTQPLYGLGFAAFVVSSFFAYRIDEWYYRFTLSRSTWLNATCDIEISGDGYRVSSLGYDLTVPWSSFTMADIFNDGILLYQTNTSSPWIPWSAFSTDFDADRFRNFTLRQFADNHRVHAEARWFGFTNGMSTHGPR